MKVEISKYVLESIRLFTKQVHPREFFAFLKGYHVKNKAVIEGLYYHPMRTTKKNVTLIPSMETRLQGIIGTVHSHPSSNLAPSKVDLEFFSKFPINMICNSEKIVMYEGYGEPISYKITTDEKTEDDVDRLHKKIFFEVLKEKESWKNATSKAAFIYAFVIFVILLLVLWTFY